MTSSTCPAFLGYMNQNALAEFQAPESTIIHKKRLPLKETPGRQAELD